MIGTASRVDSGSVAVRNPQVGRMAARKTYPQAQSTVAQPAKSTTLGAVHRHPFAHAVGLMLVALALVFGAGMVGVAIPAAAIPAAVFSGVVLAGIVVGIICTAGVCLEKVWR